MNFKALFSALALVSLTACGGGGGGVSSVPSTYSPAGMYSGTVTDSMGVNGNMDLRVDSTGSGELIVHFANQAGIDLTFSSNYGRISGNDYNVAGQFIFDGQQTQCPFSLRGTMVSPSEMDGKINGGDGSAACGGAHAVDTFRVTRTSITPQAFLKQHTSTPLF